jgi:hypothetical protein
LAPAAVSDEDDPDAQVRAGLLLLAEPFWDPTPSIALTPPTIDTPQGNQLSVYWGQHLTCTCTPATDTDTYYDEWGNPTEHADGVTPPAWTCTTGENGGDDVGGWEDDVGVGETVVWIAPTGLPGEPFLAVHQDDTGEGDRDDPDEAVARTQLYITLVHHVEYFDPYTEAWTGIPEDEEGQPTLYPLVGTTITFRAVSNYAVSHSEERWPPGMPEWDSTVEGEADGDVFTATFLNVADETVSVTTSTTKIVKVAAVSLVGLPTPDDDFAGRSYARYGVHETIQLSFTTQNRATAEQLGGLKWRNTQLGLGNLWQPEGDTGTGFYFAPRNAPAEGQTVTLRLTVQSGPSYGQSADISFTIVRPESVVYVRKVPESLWHVPGRPTVGVRLFIYLRPKDVSFTGSGFQEAFCNPTVCEGWFFQKYPQGKQHQAVEYRVERGDINLGCKCDPPNDAAVDEAAGAPYAQGTYIWNIPQRYGDLISGWWTIETKTHRGDIDREGRTWIRKAGFGEDPNFLTKALDDGPSPY